ncbi:MAG: HEPN domain-containing protein [Thaumarchaeota archaeon]|nr:HEPN domain-containing protein [Nitrososphaerota archaeon]
MNLQDLVNDGLVEEHPGNPLETRQKMDIAVQDVETAKVSIQGTGRSIDWAYNQAYNAMLQAGYAVMYSMGYRPTKSGKHHWAVEQFLKSECTGVIPPDALTAFGTARLNRHEASYDRTGVVSKSQAEYLIAQAEIFVNAVKNELQL